MERHQIVVPRLLCGGHTGRFWGKFKDEKTEAHFMSFFGNYIVWGNRPLIPFVLHLVATLVVFGVPSGEGGLEVGGVGEVGEGGDFYFSAFSHLHIFVTAATTLLYFIVERYRSNDFDEFLNGPMSVMYTGVFWATWTLFVKDMRISEMQQQVDDEGRELELAFLSYILFPFASFIIVTDFDTSVWLGLVCLGIEILQMLDLNNWEVNGGLDWGGR